MYPPSFPTEIWLEIATYLCHQDYLTLVRVCRNFYDIFIGALYSNLTVDLSKCYWFCSDNPETYFKTLSAKFASGGPAAAGLFDRLEAHPTLRNSVGTVHIKNLSLYRSHNLIGVDGLRWEQDAKEPRYAAFGAAVIEFLRGLPHLRRVNFTNLEMHNTWLLHLASHPTRHLDIHLTDVVLYGDTEPTGIAYHPTPHSLSLNGRIEWIKGPSVLSKLLCASSLRILDLPREPTWLLWDTFTLIGRQQLSHLQSLTIEALGDHHIAMLGATSNLRELIIRSGYYWIEWFDLSAFNQPSMLNRLESISANAGWIPILTTGRSIVKISTTDEFRTLPPTDVGFDFNTSEPQFGSEVMVRTVEWRSCKRVNELLEYLIARNPGVWYLNIESVRYITEYAGLLELCISKLVQLPELRTLTVALHGWAPTQRTLDWEREQCQYLKKEGCPNLVSVSFGELITWTRQPEDETYWRPGGPGMATCTRYLSPDNPSLVDVNSPVDEAIEHLLTRWISGVRHTLGRLSPGRIKRKMWH